MQGFWYRLLVDVKIYEIESACKGDIEKMKKYYVKITGLILNDI